MEIQRDLEVWPSTKFRLSKILSRYVAGIMQNLKIEQRVNFDKTEKKSPTECFLLYAEFSHT